MTPTLRQCIALRVTVLVAVAGCYDPVRPGAGIATQDDGPPGSFVAVSAGESHTCALTADGRAWCWGSNEFGQLGIAQGTTTCARGDRNISCEVRPRAVAGATRFRAIAAGGDHTCAISADDHAWCWGDNLFGQLGDPSLRVSFAPTPVITTAAFLDVSAGGSHTCGLRTDGVLLCWGDNDIGQLGVATVGVGASLPTTVQTQQRFASVSAGPRRTCARTTDGSAYCWGATWIDRNNGVELVRPQAQPFRVTQIGAVQVLSAGMNSTCALDRVGAPFCWEANPTGSIGDGTSIGSTLPQPVRTDLAFVDISSGRAHACAIAASGETWCWGEETVGQLGVAPAYIATRCGTRNISCSRLPVRVGGARVFARISAGQGDHTCGLTLGGNIYCWGAGSMGQLGYGGRAAQWSPISPMSPSM